MKIVNKKKFVRSITLTLSVITFIILSLINKSFSHTETSYKKIAVSSGDSLWSIARYEKNNNIYFENKDVRDIVYEIKIINNLDNYNLNVGDELNIPIV